MTGAADPSDKLAEVAGLATAIADHILALNAAGTPIPREQFNMFVSAARMLHDNDVPWSPSVERVVMAVAERLKQIEAPGER